MEQAPTPANFPTVRGRTIHVDENNLVCLNDIHRAAGFSVTHRPGDWRDNPSTSALQAAAIVRITGKSGNWSKSEMRSVIYAKPGQNGGTYAHVLLALAYAEYLNPDLALEVKEVFLRYKVADATLADDILERASDDEALRVAQRTLGRITRNRFTETLRDHGARGPDYALCTDELYEKLFDARSGALRAQKGLPRKANIRDAMSAAELSYVAAGEALSTERIGDENSQGGLECRIATGRSAANIRAAIEADRRDRKRALPM